MRTVSQWFEEYGESHQDETNKLIHWICVPLIFFSTYGLVASIPADFLQETVPLSVAPYAHYGNILLIPVLLFYLRLSWKLFLGMLVYSLICVFLVQVINVNYGESLWLISAILFVISWVVQIIGHKIEGEKPSFVKDLQFLLIGPAWVISFIYNKMGVKL